MPRLEVKSLQTIIGTNSDGNFGKDSRGKFSKYLSNPNAPALTQDDYNRASADLGVPISFIRGIRTVECPRTPFDDLGRPSILYERHVADRNTVPKHRFSQSNPMLFNPTGYGAGGYGSYDGQYDKLFAACALDPEAALAGCSWGAFQVLGENWQMCKYDSVLDMVTKLTKSEAAHLDCAVRFIKGKNLVAKLKACRPNDANSCIPFVTGWNGGGFRNFNYHKKLAIAIAG